MKKFLLLTMASMMTVLAMAVGRGDGSTKANAIEFDWGKGIEHAGGANALWYRVDLAPLYEEENPSLTLYLTNPSRDASVNVSMEATVAGQTESKNYTIAAHEYKTYTANASALVRMQQKEIYLTLKSDGRIKLSAKVFETADLDETCQDAKDLKWNTLATQTPGFAAWWRVDLTPVKTATNKDAKITITNTGSETVNLRAGQSLDCPSSGLTKRDYVLAPGESVINTIPQAMIQNVQPDELYFSIENIEAAVSMYVELVDQPAVPVIAAGDPFEDLHVTENFTIAAGKHYYRVSLAEMRDTAKYEPEFTYRNEGTEPVKVTVKMAFKLPAYGTSNTEYELAPGEEEIVVYKKNMLEGLSEDIEYIYLLTETDKDVNFYSRFKHVREGKACKTNIDFNWESGHSQDARTTQWYAVEVGSARDAVKDIIVHVVNEGAASAKVKASMAFSCPYIDLQEVSKTIAAGQTVSHRLGYSSYAMMGDTVWIGLETSQNIRFWAETANAEKKAEADSLCLKAETFNWEEGVRQKGDTTVWYLINMEEVRKQSAKFPTVFVQNMSATEAVTIQAELSVECPDSIENEKRSLTIAANGSYSKQLSRNLFENIVSPEVYVKVTSTQEISIQIRLTEEAEGSSCTSAIPFNWVSGNTQKAEANLWYIVDLHDVMRSTDDVKVTIENRDNAACKGIIQVAYSCPMNEAPTVQEFKLGANGTRSLTLQNSAFETLKDSFVYVALYGNTSLHIEAQRIPAEPWDTIYADGLTLIPLQWDSLYTQSVDTAWYIIPKSEIVKVRNNEEKQKPVAHLYNLAGVENTIKAEAAYAFPIVKKMMTKSQKLKAGQHFSDTVPASTFNQVLYKDSIILRVTRPAGSGDFQFKAELTKAFTGNTRYDAQPITLGKRYTQSPKTEMWYKINTADWKKDTTLFGKSLHVLAKNAGKGNAEVRVEVYEGLTSQTDLVDFYAGDRGHGTIKKGESRSHNVPAQIVYGLGDVELYIKLRTTDSLLLETSFLNYATADADPNQQKARMLVPNVDYVLPADTTMWFFACVPYWQNNYKYRDASSLSYELEGEGAATVEVTATFQDTLTYKVPVRTRTINKSGKARKGTRLLKDLLNEGIERAGVKYDISGFKEDFIDSLLHRYITKDSITAYVRVRSDKQVKLRLNTLQTTGDACLNAMDFDWEHGNVNPAGENTWYKVTLDSTMIPDTCDLRLHVENWSEENETTGSAQLRFTCEDDPMVKINKSIPAGEERTQVIDRDFLKDMQWPKTLMIDYYSDQTTHIWIELIPNTPRDIVRDTVTLFVCNGADTLVNEELHHIDSLDAASLKWEKTFELRDSAKAAMYDSIVTYYAVVLRDPKLYEVAEIADQPVIKRGQPIDVTAATTWLNTQFAAEKNDTIKAVTSIEWQYSTDGITYTDIPATPIPSEWINLKYIVTSEDCGDTYEKEYKHTVRDTTTVENVCNEYEWKIVNAKGAVIETRTYKTDTLDSVSFPSTYLGDSIAYLKLTLLPLATGEEVVKECNEYTWRGITFYTDTVYSDTITGGADNGCDSVATLRLTLTHPYDTTLSLVHKFGDRLLLINRNEINAMEGWHLDSLDNGLDYVKWYREATPEDELVGTGYYYTLETGEPLPAGETYYAKIELPSADGSCPRRGETEHYTIPGGQNAPALMPSLAKPGEDIRIIDLDPEQETLIRVFSSEGLLQATYRVSGNSSFTIKAAEAHGFYMVELSNDSLKSTLRYIVK